tara:strand:- start:6652 stop:7194 length:543 start_codon:yes stop_codon:yes gene_type:complete
MQTEINQALSVLENDGVILYPTDTIWGIGCDATNPKAINRIYEIKKRIETKALISLVDNKKQLEDITGQVPNIDITTNPTTIIYAKTKGLSKNLIAENGSAAIRIVKHKFCNRLIQKLGKPIVSTSANISGEPFPTQFSEISNEIKNNVDYIVNLQMNEKMSNPSTILLINKDGNIKKIR